MYTRYTTTVRNNVCCKFILEYNQTVSLEIMMDFFNGIKLEKDSISPNP